MDKHTLLILTGMLTSPFIAVWVQGFFNKKKTGAEVQNLNISGEISIGDAWKRYAEKQEENTKNLRDDFKELRNEFEKMKREKDAEIHAKDKKIQELEHRIETLEAEIEMHRNVKK